MLGHKSFFVTAVALCIITMLNHSIIYSAKQPAQQVVELTSEVAGLRKQVEGLESDLKKAGERVDDIFKVADAFVDRARIMDVLTHSAAERADKANTASIEFGSRIEKLEPKLKVLEEQMPAAQQEQERLSAKSEAEIKGYMGNAIKMFTAFLSENKKSPEQALKEVTAAAEIMAKANADAVVDAEKQKGIEFRKTINDNIPKITIAVITAMLCIYVIKYGLPALMNYLIQPRIISETSRPGVFEWFKPKQAVAIDDLIFTPHLQKQLLDLLLRVQTAKKYDETLPNVLFYGAPGTGKTAFVKALAYESGLDYALTSGSEFAKITDLNQANNELRKLLNWAKRSKNGLIVFIDEAESLFANRKLATTSKATQDFINTFLSLVSDQSQKKVMFIFATNHPFKLDDAITNRVGINIEFTLPEGLEREKILSMYLVKSTQENEEAIVDLHPDIIKLLPKYAESLKGFSPRAIKFVAEEMIINARRQWPMQLTNDIALAIIDQAINSLQQTELWEKERSKWVGGLNVVHA